MNACLSATGLMQRLRLMRGMLALSFLFCCQAQAAPVVVSVDHRVTVSYSRIEFNARKGIYTTEIRIRNRSGAALLSPLKLVFDQAALGDIRLVNEQGLGKEGQPYFEFVLPKGVLSTGGTTVPVKVAFFIGKDRKLATKVGDAGLRRTLLAASSVSAGVELAPLTPRAEPYALNAGDGEAKVRFSVVLAGNAGASNVYLRRSGARNSIAMNDNGQDGDLIARDGIYGVRIAVDTSGLKPDSCLSYEAYTGSGRTELVSPPLKLCASSFPVRIAASDTAKPVVLADGTKAVADEILVTATSNTRSDAIRRLAAEVGAEVAGSILPLDMYQLKLSAPVSAGRLTELVAQLGKSPGVRAASVNAIGSYAYTPSDPEFVNQQGLQRIRAHDVWDTGATGNGVTITILDSGLDKTHPDFGTSPASCQLAENDCGSPNTDSVGHGTWVAGVVGARTNNALGVAGVANGGKIHSIIVAGGAAPTVAQMTQGFTDAAAYGIAPVINASFAVLASTFTNVTSLCAAVNSAVLSGATPVAVVVNAAGNSNSNSYYYPGRCNVNEPAATPHAGQNEALTRKDLLITVANSASVVAAACGSVPLDQRCTDSNYGAWLDIAAPGSVIRTTAVGGGYMDQSGTSLAAPMVAGAAAILRSCGVTLDQVESTLRTSALVNVPFPDGTSAPRLDVFEALKQRSAPAWAGPMSYIVNENINTAGGYEVGTLTATNAMGCDRYTFTIGGGADAGKFGIGGVGNDRLMLNDGMLDFETKSSYSVIVHVTDYFNKSFDQPLTVNVINLNEPPTGVVLSNTVPSTPENGGSIKVADISVIDDALGTNTLYLSGPDWASFSIVGNALYFNGGADFETKNIYNVTVNVDDVSVGATPDATQNFVLMITNANEAPVANNDTLAASQNTPVTYAAAQLLGNDTDVDAGTTLAVANVTSGTGGTAVLNGDGTVTFTPNMGFIGAASFTYTATDGGLNSNAATVTVNVAAVPHAPVANSDTLAATEDIPVTYTAAQLLANDTDADAGTTLTIADVTSGMGGTVVLNGDGTVSFSPSLNFNGAANFSYRATDGGLTSNVATVTVNVAPMNDAPTGTPAILPPAANGTRTVGQTITADTSAIADADCPSGFGTGPVCSFQYQWRRDGGNVGVGTGSDTYLLDATDIGGFMSLCVSYTDGGGTIEGPLCSANDAVAVGDPHITTVDGLYYDFQSAGEFVALRDADGLEIQVRQSPVSTAAPLTDSNSGLTSGVSVNTAVAARVGKHRVTYQADANNTVSGAPVLRVDGVVTTLQAGGIDFGDGGRVTPQGSGIQIDFPDHTTLIASSGQWINNVWWMHLSVYHTPSYEGIMGARLKGSWLPRLSDGSALGTRPAAMHDRYVDLYVKFADSWRVNNKTSLFDYAEGTSTATFTNKAWPTENGPFVAGSGPIVKPLARKAALLACRNVVGKNENAGCVFDVMVMGNKDIANAHLLNQKVRLGATQVIVRGAARPDARGNMVFTATVARHAAAVPPVRNIRAVPAGMVQFLINGEKAGAPVKLDEKGQAKWKVPYQRFFKQQVTAQYIPARGTAFLPSSAIVRTGLVLEKR